MPAGGAVSAGIGGAIGLGQAIYGAIAKRKAQAAAAANKMPEYNIPQYEGQNLALAESRANSGMSDAARQQLLNNSMQGQSATLSAILRGGGDANAIGNTVDKFQNGINQNAVYEDQARLANLARVQSAWARASNMQDKEYQINKYQPWANKAQAIGQQLTGGQNMMMGGIDKLGSALMGGVKGLLDYNSNMLKPGHPRDTSGDMSLGTLPIGQQAMPGYNGNWIPNAAPPAWSPLSEVSLPPGVNDFNFETEASPNKPFVWNSYFGG